MLSRPAFLLKLEDTCLLIAAVLLYRHLQFSWILFAILFLTPDLFMLGYLINQRAGSSLYNLGHTLFIPLALFATAYRTHQHLLTAIATIWFSHIAFDRVLGYGLKYPTHFKDTHLQYLR
jgi:hypothetical protein